MKASAYTPCFTCSLFFGSLLLCCLLLIFTSLSTYFVIPFDHMRWPAMNQPIYYVMMLSIRMKSEYTICNNWYKHLKTPIFSLQLWPNCAGTFSSSQKPNTFQFEWLYSKLPI